jgi:anhydro-N-acetylmuramic acid kinase
MAEIYLGLMSGTSLDGVDGVLADFSQAKPQVLAHASLPFGPALQAQVLALNSAGPNELHSAALAGNALARAYAQVVGQLLQSTGLQASDVMAIGAHGQTVRHQPQAFDGTGYTLQINNPALLAELCGMDVVADFRSRDVAAGGQGAPLVPAFHKAVFGRSSEAVAVLNIGGIANLSFIGPTADASSAVTGFDCGPGNVLLDLWCQRHLGKAYDAAGQWAASGQAIPALLAHMLADPYFAKVPPKSTGRDLFHAAWLDAHLREFPTAKPEDVQATLVELTVSPLIDCVSSYQKYSNCELKYLLVCGGGAYNSYLMQRVQAVLPSLQTQSTETHGLPPLQVEACAFAWLARQFCKRRAGNLPAVTGARGERVLGALYPA